ncbi:hypothetical protein Srufu_066540 [Streptomyces libani subsp. rufus]|nr:hypothetical protein Srufu_066540 [Streptomyces libani subsp. rufus]
MQLPGEDAITTAGALPQPAQLPCELRRFRPHPAPLFVPPFQESIPGSGRFPRSEPVSAFRLLSLSRIGWHPGARRAGCEQHTETGAVMRTRWCISDVVAVAVLIICAAVVITLIIRHGNPC